MLSSLAQGGQKPGNNTVDRSLSSRAFTRTTLARPTDVHAVLTPSKAPPGAGLPRGGDMTRALAYLAVLLSAAVPWFELFTIPPSIALGLDPVVVGLVAFTGNAVATIATVLGWERIATWWERRRGRPPGEGSRRSARGRRVLERYGVPGLALQGPAVTGIYLAAVLALSLGAGRRSVLLWSLASIALWSIVLVAATVAGITVLVDRPGATLAAGAAW